MIQPASLVLDGRFQVVRLLSEGGMGEVYLAEQVSLGRRVALKVLRSDLSSQPMASERFRREARLLSSVEHPAVVGVIDFGESEGRPCLVMELAEGETLQEALVPGPFAPERAVHVLVQLADGLAAIHEKGIIHRDLKPENVVLTRSVRGEQARWLDFGIARLAEVEGQAAREGSLATASGVILGTPEYVSPEQGYGGRLDVRSDLYSFGVLAFRTLSGKLPFVGPSPRQFVSQHISAQPIPLYQAAPELVAHVPLCELVMRCLKKNPAERPQTALELSEALGRSLRTARASKEEVPATEPPTPPQGSVVVDEAVLAEARESTVGPGETGVPGTPYEWPSEPAETSAARGETSTGSAEAPAARYPSPAAPYGTSGETQATPGQLHGQPAARYAAPATPHGTADEPLVTPSEPYRAPAGRYASPAERYGAPAQPHEQQAAHDAAPAAPHGAPGDSDEVPAAPHETSRGSYETPAALYGTPGEPYEAPAEPYEVPAAPYGAPGEPYEVPAEPYEMPAAPHEPPPAPPADEILELAERTAPAAPAELPPRRISRPVPVRSARQRGPRLSDIPLGVRLLALGALVAAVSVAGAIAVERHRLENRARAFLDAGQPEQVLGLLGSDDAERAPLARVKALRAAALHRLGRHQEELREAAGVDLEAVGDLDLLLLDGLAQDYGRSHGRDEGVRKYFNSWPREAIRVPFKNMAAEPISPREWGALRYLDQAGIAQGVNLVERYVTALRDSDCEVRAQAARRLRQLGSLAALEPLEQAAASPGCGQEVVLEAVRSLRRRGTP